MTCTVVQESRQAIKCVREFREICMKLVQELRARGPPASDDVSIGGQLLQARDPFTGLLTCSTVHVRCATSKRLISLLSVVKQQMQLTAVAAQPLKSLHTSCEIVRPMLSATRACLDLIL